MKEPTNEPTRRNFLVRVGVGLSALATTLAAVPILGYLLSPLRSQRQRAWISLGPVSAFPVGETRLASFQNPYQHSWDGPTAEVPCYVRRVADDQFQVFAVNCTHLGCPVRWFPESGLFMCPCHGGVYYGDGGRASGPPPRALFEYETSLRNGQLWVRGGALPTLATPA
jgi:menaquinol-cytochrome c reductase iron-sulfur subunit